MTCGYLPRGGTGDVTFVAMSNDGVPVRAADAGGGRWKLTGGSGLVVINDYLGYVADRGYSPRSALNNS